MKTLLTSSPLVSVCFAVFMGLSAHSQTPAPRIDGPSVEAHQPVELILEYVLAEQSRYAKLLANCKFVAYSKTWTEDFADKGNAKKLVEYFSRVNMVNGDLFVQNEIHNAMNRITGTPPGTTGLVYEPVKGIKAERFIVTQNTIGLWPYVDAPVVEIYEKNSWGDEAFNKRCSQMKGLYFYADPALRATSPGGTNPLSKSIYGLSDGNSKPIGQWTYRYLNGSQEGLLEIQRAAWGKTVDLTIILDTRNCCVIVSAVFKPGNKNRQQHFEAEYHTIDGVPFPKQFKYFLTDDSGEEPVLEREITYEEVEIIDDGRRQPIALSSLNFPDNVYGVFHLPGEVQKYTIARHGEFVPSNVDALTVAIASRPSSFAQPREGEANLPKPQ
ncbi:MAG: hypothetical protein AMXMBFR84_04210 [Candidatus Hydrogenedentota bacterium]